MTNKKTINLQEETKNFFGRIDGWFTDDDGETWYKKIDNIEQVSLRKEEAQQITKAIKKDRLETAMSLIQSIYVMGNDGLPDRPKIDHSLIRKEYALMKRQLEELNIQ